MNDLTRRAVIGAGAAGVVAGVVGTAPAEAAAPRRKQRPRPGTTVKGRKAANLYTRSRFAALLDQTFQLGGVAVTLAAVTDLAGAPAGAEGSFGLTFRAAAAGPPQGSYLLRRTGFTPTTLFVVPSDEDRRTYEAVVHRAG